MGVMNHNAVIATTCHDMPFESIIAWIRECSESDREMFVILPQETVNGYRTVFLKPDGSKEGWYESNQGDDLRIEFIDQLKKRGDYWNWVEVGFGEYGQAIIRGNCQNLHNDRPYAVF